MLYQEKPLGRVGFGGKIAARLAHMFSRQRHADADLLAMSPHLRRDLGLDGEQCSLRADYIWRK